MRGHGFPIHGVPASSRGLIVRLPLAENGLSYCDREPFGNRGGGLHSNSLGEDRTFLSSSPQPGARDPVDTPIKPARAGHPRQKGQVLHSVRRRFDPATAEYCVSVASWV